MKEFQQKIPFCAVNLWQPSPFWHYRQFSAERRSSSVHKFLMETSKKLKALFIFIRYTGDTEREKAAPPCPPCGGKGPRSLEGKSSSDVKNSLSCLYTILSFGGARAGSRRPAFKAPSSRQTKNSRSWLLCAGAFLFVKIISLPGDTVKTGPGAFCAQKNPITPQKG